MNDVAHRTLGSTPTSMYATQCLSCLYDLSVAAKGSVVQGSPSVHRNGRAIDVPENRQSWVLLQKRLEFQGPVKNSEQPRKGKHPDAGVRRGLARVSTAAPNTR